MLEGKAYHAVKMVFSFVAAFIDRATGYTNEVQITDIHTPYSDLVNVLLVHHEDLVHHALDAASKDIQ